MEPGKQQYYQVAGRQEGLRLESRLLEEKIQKAVEQGHRFIDVCASGQHGIGGRLWKAGKEPLYIRVSGQSGQRLGAMGFENTRIEALGPASDDVGWLNAGAEIVVHGNAGNGVANAMAQGRVYVAGNIGARGMTMTKENPRFSPPELWVLGSVGDYFGEFMAGGIAVVCGVEPQSPGNILGYRPLVGMVGGKVFFRGPHGGYSKSDARLSLISDADWHWLQENLERFASAIDQRDILSELLDRDRWQLLTARAGSDRLVRNIRSIREFSESVWNRELGSGGLFGDLTDADMTQIPVIPTGELRRYAPLWANRIYKAPCEAACPTGIPVHERWRMIRNGRMQDAVNMALVYTPFPAAVCGYLCPNLCMSACTRQSAGMPALDIARLGKASLEAKMPDLPPVSGGRVAVIGGGPAGISFAWQLRMRGHEAVIYDRAPELGGKILSVIPETRIPREVVEAELARVKQAISHVNLQQDLSRGDIEALMTEMDYVVLAAGAQKPKNLPVPGSEKAIAAYDFLRRAKSGAAAPGRRIVIIGAGNVGCDVAIAAHHLGAETIVLIDVQEPAAFAKEMAQARAVGAEFRWPCYTSEITDAGVLLQSGELLAADTVVAAIGEMPDLGFLPDSVRTQKGYIVVDEHFQSTDPQIFAIGDAVSPGLLTDAIGAGRIAAEAIGELLKGRGPQTQAVEGDFGGTYAHLSEFAGIHELFRDRRETIDPGRIRLEYFDPRKTGFQDLAECGEACASCGACRDCGLCEALCPRAAISRREKENGGYEYVADDQRCIGCGFCAAACPCGVWEMVENPL
ncbi:MAG: FAD-dependent oxidoreductase [Desulfosalsimonadaceae bacterium]